MGHESPEMEALQGETAHF